MTLGWFGERLAGWHLRRKGFRILSRNYRCSAGEIDLIAFDRDTLVFVEVKTRRSHFLPPEANIHRAKRDQLMRLARYFLARFPQVQAPCRFDVVAVTIGPGIRVRFEHFIDALHDWKR